MSNKYSKYTAIKLLSVAVIAIVALAAGVWLMRSCETTSISIETDERIDITPSQIKSLEAIGEWEFMSIYDEEMVDTIRKGFFSDDKLVRIYYGTLRLGVNMHEANPGWISRDKDSTLVVKMPPVKLLSNDFIDEAQTRAFIETGTWTDSDRKHMYTLAYNRMKKRNITPKNIKAAEENAKEQMRSILQSMGFEKIRIEFAK